MNPTNHRNEFRSKVRGCFLGIAIGDALGMPWETMSPEAIRRHAGDLGVRTFWPPQQTRIADTAGMAAGATTDDWQLTRVVAESLTATKGHLDLGDCADRHVAAVDESQFDWGRTTREAIEAIRDGRRLPSEPLPPPQPGTGCGNGIVMKIAPIAVTHAMRQGMLAEDGAQEKLLADCMLLCGLTHPDEDAGVAAYVVANLLGLLLTDRRCSLSDRWLIQVASPEAYAAAVAGSGFNEDRRVPRSFQEVLLGGGAARFYEKARAEKRGFLGPESAATAVGVFLESRIGEESGEMAVKAWTKIIGFGGDTDTNASILGGLIGAEIGEENLPEPLRKFNPALEAEAISLADRLVDACL